MPTLRLTVSTLCSSLLTLCVLATDFGAKNTFWFFLTTAAVLNFLVPIAGASMGLPGVCACRFVFGLCQGPLFPIMTAILAGWLHEDERSTISACVGCCWALFQGFQSTVTPYFMAGPGWSWAFYSYSIIVAVWSYCWYHYGVGIDPKKTARCSAEEAEYLVDKGDKKQEDSPENISGDEGFPAKQEFSWTVWFAVLRQPVVWGMALTTVIKGFGEPVFLTYVSTQAVPTTT